MGWKMSALPLFPTSGVKISLEITASDWVINPETQGSRATLQFTAGRNTDRSDNYQGTLFTDRFATHRDSAGLQADFGLFAEHATLGEWWRAIEAQQAA